MNDIPRLGTIFVTGDTDPEHPRRMADVAFERVNLPDGLRFGEPRFYEERRDDGSAIFCCERTVIGG